MATRVSLKQQPKLSTMANGHGKRGPVKLAASTAHSTLDDAAAAAKRKRKPKKPYLVRIITATFYAQLIS